MDLIKKADCYFKKLFHRHFRFNEILFREESIPKLA